MIALTLLALTVSLSADPDLPAPNLLTDPKFRFETGFKGAWANASTNGMKCVEMEGHGLSFFTSGKKTIYTCVPQSIVRPGHTYILSCDIKPSSKVSEAAIRGAGLGCNLTFWSKDWKQAVGLSARGEGADRWQRVSSQPVTIPDWAHHNQLHVGLAYTGGSGYVDNIELVEAYSDLAIDVKSERAIRQVVVVDQNFHRVFDSGVLTGEAKTWSRHLKIEAAYQYAVYAVDDAGTVTLARYPSAEAQRFRIEKLGTLALDRVETNPVVYRGKPYIFEFDRATWSGGWFRSLDKLKDVTPKVGEGLAFACAFADGDRIAVTGSAGGTDTWSRCEIRMTESTNMVSWTKPRCILRKKGWVVFNTSVCKADGRYVMVFERGDPCEEVGVNFTMFFAESKDFETWRQVPGARFGNTFYTGSPCLKYHDGWFYFFYLAHAGKNELGKDLWRMRVVRSQTLADGSWQFGNRDVLGFDEADRKPYPGVRFNAKALKRLATAEDRNASDIDMTDVRGDLVITYSWGNQEGTEHQALARIRNCTEADFCKSFFTDAR